jgi:hypothetical protein
MARDTIQGEIIKAYELEREKAKLPGYVCNYDEIDAGDFDAVPSFRPHDSQSPRGPRRIGDIPRVTRGYTTP